MVEHEHDDEGNALEDEREAVRPANQGQNLPDPNTSVVNFLLTNSPKTTLADRKDLPAWLSDVTTVLDGLQISQVIDDTIPRPPLDTVEAKRWWTITKKVKGWLCSGVSQEIIAQMKSTGAPMNFAHDFVRVLKETLRGEGTLTRMQVWKEFHNEAAKTDAKASEYVAKTLRAFTKASSQGVEMQPMHALYIIMDRLRGSYDFPTSRLMWAIDDQHPDRNTWSTYSMEELQTICSDLIMVLEEWEVDHDSRVASTQTTQTNPSKKRKRHHPRHHPRHQQQNQQKRVAPEEE